MEVFMDIHPSLNSRSKLNKPGIARTAAENKAATEALKAREVQSASSSAGTNSSQWQEGQVVRGQIIDHRYNEVKIQLEPDKQIVHARLTGDIPLSIGEEARFQVTEDSPERLTLKYIPDAAPSSDPTVLKALTASGFPMTERNKQIVEELLRHTMPVDKQTLQTLIQLSHTHREASPLTLVLMYKNNIPMTSANVNQFEAYQNGTGQLLGEIRQTVKSLIELLRPENPSAPDRVILSDSPQAEFSLLQSPADPGSFTDSDVAAGNPMSRLLRINHQLTELLYGADRNPPLPTADTSPTQVFPQDTPSQLAEELQRKLTASPSLSEEPGLFSPGEAVPTNFAPILSQPSQPELMPYLLEGSPSAASSAPITQHLDPSELTALAERLNAAPDTEAMAAKIADGFISSRELLLFLREKLPGMSGERAIELLSSAEYQKLMEGAFLDKWTLTPDKLMKKAAIKELYQQLSEDAEKLASITRLGKAADEDGAGKEPVKQLQDNLRFMKDLNEVFTYLQLPVQLTKQTVHSELYVYTRKKALQNKENLSVLLHLDMPHLGSMNIRIQMEHNTIHAGFFLEDTAAQGILSDYMPSLTDALAKKGYHLLSEVSETYRKIDFSKDFIEEKAGEGEIRRYSFDIRT
jgi:hypothetical protein